MFVIAKNKEVFFIMTKENKKEFEEQYIEPLFKDTNLENGYGFVSRQIMRDKTLSKNSKALYAYFMSFAGTRFTAFPSRETIKEELGFGSQHTYYESLKELKERGLVTTRQEKRINESGKAVYSKTIFTIHIKNNDIELNKNSYSKNCTTEIPCSKNCTTELSTEKDQKIDVPCCNLESSQKCIHNSNNLLNSNISINSNTVKNNNIDSDSFLYIDIWNKALENLKTIMTEVSYKTWIKSLALIEINKNIAILSAPNEFTKGIIEERYINLIYQQLKEISGRDYRCKIIINN